MRALLLLFLLLPTSLMGAVAHSQSVTGSAGSGTSTLASGSVTVSGSDRYLTASIEIRLDGASVSSCNWNTSETLSLKGNSANAGNNIVGEVWELKNPTATTSTVSCTLSTTSGNKTIIVNSFTGVHQTTPSGTPTNFNAGSGTSRSTNISSTTDDLVFDFLALPSGATAINVGASQTERPTSGIDFGDVKARCSTEPGAGTVTMSWSWTTSVQHVHVAFNIAAAPTIRPAWYYQMMMTGQILWSKLCERFLQFF